MRVCQFRHFGTHENPAQMAGLAAGSSVAKPLPCVKLFPYRDGLPRTDSLVPASHNHLLIIFSSRKRTLSGMYDMRQNDASMIPEPKIPSELAAHIRRLSHDLSNALEVILQTNYLLGMTEASEDSRKWRQMLDNGVLQATQINQQLRDYLRANS